MALIWVSHEVTGKVSAGLQSSEGPTRREGSSPKVAPSHGLQVGAGCWQSRQFIVTCTSPWDWDGLVKWELALPEQAASEHNSTSYDLAFSFSWAAVTE